MLVTLLLVGSGAWLRYSADAPSEVAGLAPSLLGALLLVGGIVVGAWAVATAPRRAGRVSNFLSVGSTFTPQLTTRTLGRL